MNVLGVVHLLQNGFSLTKMEKLILSYTKVVFFCFEKKLVEIFV